MNVRQLKRFLETIPEETLIFMEVEDHQLRPVDVNQTYVLRESKNSWTLGWHCPEDKNVTIGLLVS